MINKEYVNEQANVCREKFEAIMESFEKGEDIDQALINLDAAFEVFYDRWVLYFTNHECPEHTAQDAA